MNGKRNSSLIHASLIGSALLLACASANAVPTTVTLNLQTGAVTSSSLYGSFLSAGSDVNNPAGTTLGTVLSYAFPTVYPASSLQPENGVVYIYADAAHTELRDVIGFAYDGPSYMVVMSLVPGYAGYVSSLPNLTSIGNLADAVYLTEGAGGVTTYSPTGQPQPGFLDDGGLPETYTFNDPTVPDGGTTVGLLGMSLVGLASLRKRLARA